MNTNWSAEIENVLNVGHRLDANGINNWALTRTQALGALDKMLALQVPVLGGDVCERANHHFRLNYDNWYCEQLTDEADADFVTRSITKATEYISAYPFNPASEIFFILVPAA